MPMDVVDLREFYLSPLGQNVRALLRQRIARLWPDVKGETILALGYATPLLRPWLSSAERLLAVMPAELGVAYWPKEGPNVACLADLAALPLPDESVSRVVLLHALETAPDPSAVLQEVWRVLRPNGQVLVIVPNRRGLWAKRDTTPFGTGQPYSGSQLRRLVKEEGFSVQSLAPALLAPPCCESGLGLWFATRIEPYASGLFHSLGGVLMLEASKQVFTPALVKGRMAKRRLVLPMPFPASPLPTGRGVGRGGLAFQGKACITA